MVLLVMFVIRHNLTSEALENLLSIIKHSPKLGEPL